MTNAVLRVLIFTFLLDSSKCTKARKDMEGYVVGGHSSNIEEFPHSVFLKAYCNFEWICGSAVLNQRIIITAAHCIFGCQIIYGHRIEVLAGSGNLKQVNIKRSVKRFVVHNNYDEDLLQNDIGLALLDKDFPLGENVKRVIIQKIFPENTYFATVAGWGVVNEDTGLTSTMLKQVAQKLRSKTTCAKIGDLMPGTFCAGSENFYEDHPAEGDSGNALITSKFTAIGIVSFRIPVFPALLVYTNTSYYYSWVTQRAQEIYCSG